MSPSSTVSDIVLAAAQAAHEANRAWCAFLGDTTQPPWDAAPDWQKQSCVAGVEGVRRGNTPSMSHESWLNNKTAQGWVYGPVKDSVAKTHPCMVPYKELSPSQKAKDSIFVSVVSSVLWAAINAGIVGAADVFPAREPLCASCSQITGSR